jgi:hypothetical protein
MVMSKDRRAFEWLHGVSFGIGGVSQAMASEKAKQPEGLAISKDMTFLVFLTKFETLVCGGRPSQPIERRQSTAECGRK